jgi:hypothetical protein
LKRWAVSGVVVHMTLTATTNAIFDRNFI